LYFPIEELDYIHKIHYSTHDTSRAQLLQESMPCSNAETILE